ncbi:DUF2264 domain-containing protein [Halosimplex salinum]|uniref:DUF2264 domain-containing protein n=1 Tax=Halosimplex salinum TaxID=1710538 RepID=UPI000F4A21B1|nr:DUF2264 domain-containing protein [Halosimplex salinum]
MNPLADNPLETRSDFQSAVVSLYEPLKPHFSPGRARVNPDPRGASHSEAATGMEGFSRPLWGLVPLAAGDGEFDDWDRYRTGLVNGTDPDHPEYWGNAGDYSQKHVELAAIGFGLAVASDELWDPLDERERANVTRYLNQVVDADLYDCNWLYWRVLVTLGLRSVGADHDWAATRETMDRLESFSLDDGWYADGPGGCRDYYVAWAMQVYGLVYAELAGDEDPERAERLRERARLFAREFRHWFADDGAGLPYGRSLTYRFAQASFWGALAFAGVEALPWGEIRGLWARNIRWWADQPIFTGDGRLSVGYRYPTIKTSEPYNSQCSPYWGTKAFLPLALPSDHPFWRADERPLGETPTTTVQREPGMVVCRDRDADHHYALTAGQNSHYLEKYTKFAYSTEFGFGVRSRAPGLGGAGLDSALALTHDGRDYRTRIDVTETEVDGDTLYARWEPWDDVTVDTWLAPASPWHVRVHRLDTDRALESAEGGFPMDRSGEDDTEAVDEVTDGASAVVRYPAGTSGVRDLRGDRSGAVVGQDPNTNVVAARTVVPTLQAEYEPGTHWLVTAATAATAEGDPRWDRPPRLVGDGSPPVVENANGTELLSCDGDAPGPLDGFRP